MPFSHHSHSGQYCDHGTNTLEEMVQAAIEKKMTTFCLTEHMPRDEIDFYPGESEVHTKASLEKLYDDFYQDARRLQKLYADRIRILIGFECDWIRKSSLTLIETLLEKYPIDLFVGSVHHLHTIPIDYDTDMYRKARGVSGGTDGKIFEDYFDAQYEMLQALRPPVVGHFDLIRLKSDDPDRSFHIWPSVWGKIERNLEFIAGYGGVVELNSSSLRKGMSEAYPQSEICKVFQDLGGGFTLSDDSHGVDQVGLNYDKLRGTLTRAGIRELRYLAPAIDPASIHDARFPAVCWERISLPEVEALPFFETS